MDAITYVLSKKYTNKKVQEIVDLETPVDAMARLASVDANGVDYLNLKTRLDTEQREISSQLAHKATKEEINNVQNALSEKAPKSYVDSELLRKRDVASKIEPEDASERFLQLVTGQGTIHLLSIPQNYSVTPEKFYKVEYLDNRFDKDCVEVGKFLSKNDGTVSDWDAYITSDYCVVEPLTTYGIAKVMVYCFYDSNKNFISGVQLDSYTANHIFETPENAHYVRFSFLNTANLDTMKLVKGDTVPLGAMPFGFKIPDIIVNEKNIEEKSVIKGKIGDKAVIGNNLDTDYTYKGLLPENTDFNTVTDAGSYLFVGNMVNVPNNLTSSSGRLWVDKLNKRWVSQIIWDLRQTNKYWIRFFDELAEPPYQNWREVNLESDGSTGDYKPLQGNKVVCFGDSITQYSAYTDIIAQITGAEVYNVGFGGCRMAAHTASTYREFSMHKLVDAIVSGDWSKQDEKAAIIGGEFPNTLARLKAIDFNTIDYISIFYGTNDFGGGVPLGDIDSTDVTTFRGAINHVVETLLTAYPHLKILFVCPMWRARISSGDGLDVDLHPNDNGDYLIDFVDAEIEMANKHKMPHLDMFRTSGINKYNHTVYLKDGLHPTEIKGAERIGRKIASHLILNQ